MSTPVVVACDGVKLKLTCTAELLSKPFVECIVAPFLGAYNKKRGTAIKPVALAKVEVDGAAVSDLSLSGAAVLGGSEHPSVVLHLPSDTACTSEPCVDAAAFVLKLDPARTPTADSVVALKALRAAIKETPSGAGAAVTPRLIAILAEFSALTSADAAWTAASAEAAVCINNLLVAARDKSGALLCANELGAVPRLIASFEKASELPLPRLRLLSPIAFHLSLQPAIGAHATRFAAAIRTCLLYVSSSLACMKHKLTSSARSEANW